MARFEIYRDGASFSDRDRRGSGECRWRLVAEDGTVIAGGGASFATVAGARDGIEGVKRDAPSADIVKLV